jgi:hypothetical protein
MHESDKRLLRAYWRATYTDVRVTRAGEVWARKAPGRAFGILETASQAAESVKVLRAQAQAFETARSRRA